MIDLAPARQAAAPSHPAKKESASLSRMKRRDFIGFLTLAASGVANTRLFSFARRKQEKEVSEDGEAVKRTIEPAEKGRCWVFDTWGNQKGWTVPTGLTGAVMGGGLWLTLT